MKTRITALLLATPFLLTMVPLAAAENEYETDEQNVPPSRDYIDLATSLTYNYDATTGLLTPTGTTAAITAYACADAYLRNQATTCGTTYNPCPRRSCTSALTAIITSGQIRHVHQVTGSCGVTLTVTFTQNSNQVVSYLSTGMAADWCTPGSQTVWNYVDGVLRSSDRVFF